MQVSVIGAGVAGLTCALELAARGAEVQLLESAAAPGPAGCSWFAGGMLAPWCELESCGPLIAQLGAESLPWWAEHFPGTVVNGTLVVAHGRDLPELTQFARRTGHCRPLDADGVGALEPELAGRFAHGLHFGEEGHLDPRAALAALLERARACGVSVRFGTPGGSELRGPVIDCTGLAARAALPDLRGVRGEMLLLRQPELALARPVRVLHPRLPVYVVPRGAGLFLVGATMLESDAATRVSARALLELLSAAYALHPAFGEAEVVEIGSGVRPAFPDNQPRLEWRGSRLYVNGLYRHGFLVAPALARRAAAALLEGRHFAEVMGENPGQRRLA